MSGETLGTEAEKFESVESRPSAAPVTSIAMGVLKICSLLFPPLLCLAIGVGII